MLKKGQVLNNRYQIHAVLGEGGFGAVYKVWDDNLQRHCAIKENLQVGAESQKQFKREAIMLANLNHPHLVRVTDYFIIQEQGQYLVMDYVEGNDLETILTDNGGPLPSEQALAWIRQVCDALIYIHNQNPPIIHRDIKPANIRITPQGNAVLVDFGLAKTFDDGIKTTIGARGLTPHYAAPEQYGSGGTDAQSDIYSLGVTLYCLLTYRVPPDSVEIMVGNVNPPLPAKTINRNIPDPISDALQRAMQIRRTDRYKSVSDFKDALVGEQKTPAQAKKTVREGEHRAEKETFVAPVEASAKLLDYVGKSIQLQAYDAKRGWLTLDTVYTVTNENLPALAYVLKNKGYQIVEADLTPLEIKSRASRKSRKADSLYKLGRYEEAIRYYDEALEIHPRAVDALNNKGNSLHSLGRYEDAIRCYDQTLELDPRDVVALGNKGSSLNGLGRYEEAIRYYDEALEIHPRYVFALTTKALSLDSLGRYEEAIRYCDMALEIDPRNLDGLFNKADSLNELGRKRKAVQSYRKFLAIAPAQHAKRIEYARQRIKELEGR